MPAAVDRGNAVEVAVEDVLLGKKKLTQAVDDAVEKFNRATGKKLNDTTVEKERGQIGTMTEIALDALRIWAFVAAAASELRQPARATRY